MQQSTVLGLSFKVKV